MNSQIRLGASVLIFILIVAIFAPSLAQYDPRGIALERELCLPSKAHLLGCDTNGTDILSIIIYGSRVSLLVGIVVTFFCVLIGLVVGSFSAISGGWKDSLVMRLLDVIFSFPGIILAIALASMLGPSKLNLIICLVATGWAGYARLVRAEILNIKKMEYIEAARALGMPTSRIVLFHLWPNIISPVLVTATFGVAGTILAEASLSFLGIGVPPGTPSWGSLLSFGKDVLVEAPHVATFPGLAIMVTVFSFHLLGEGLRRKLDPKASR